MMMLIGREMAGYDDVLKVQVPPWDDPTDDIHSPFDDFQAPEMVGYDDVLEVVEYDDFRMYEFKVRRCARGRSHDWTECPYAHPGEKARRRDPRKFHYSGNPCPEFRKGTCGKGDTCEFAHGVFECWLHPSRYRTQPCKDGVSCRRRICFFAHTPEQLRVLPASFNGSTQTHPESYDGSPSRFGIDSFVGKGSSPTSTLYPPPCSPPMSPIGSNSVNELASSIRNLQIGNAARFVNSPAFCSGRSLSILRPGVASLPATPTRNPTRSGQNAFDNWDQNQTEEEPMMERVESGRELRAKIYAKLSRENSLAGRVDSPATGSESGWVYELVN